MTSHQRGRDAQYKLSNKRVDIIADAFASLDSDHSGKALLSEVTARYDVLKHPLVLDGQMAPSKATQILLNHFEPCAAEHGGTITWDEFFTFHAKISKEVDGRRESDPDGYFVSLVTSLWRLNVAKLPTTNIAPISLEKPTGLSATRGMDFIWPSEDGKLTGYKGVVSPTFARFSLPESLRGYFALPQELLQVSVSYLPIQSAVQPAYDLVWRDAEDQPYVGFQGIIAANIDYASLPAFLQQFVLTPKESASLKVQFFPTEKASNPFYKKSSQSIGVKADEYALRVNDIKKQLHEGTLRGTVFAGRTGSFTRQFAGGMPVTSGFNV